MYTSRETKQKINSCYLPCHPSSHYFTSFTLDSNPRKSKSRRGPMSAISNSMDTPNKYANTPGRLVDALVPWENPWDWLAGEARVIIVCWNWQMHYLFLQVPSVGIIALFFNHQTKLFGSCMMWEISRKWLGMWKYLLRCFINIINQQSMESQFFYLLFICNGSISRDYL